MSKILKALLLIGCVFFVFLIGRCVYMVLSISSTIPHIKDYEFAGTVRQFENGVKKLSVDNRDIKIKVTDIYNDGRRAFDLQINSDADSILYQIKGDSINENKSEIQIIGAFKTTPKAFLGGYGIKGDGVKELVNRFDNDFLVRLKKSQHLSLKPKE